MKRSHPSAMLGSVFAAILGGSGVFGQVCAPEWQAGFGSGDLSNNGFVYAMTADTSHSPPGVWVGGVFTRAGSLTVDNLARWDGATYTAPPPSPEVAQPFGMLMFDFDGPGPQPPSLVVASIRSSSVSRTGGVAVWDGVSWTRLGTIMADCYSIASWDDGTGPHLYAMFDSRPIQRWSGSAWTDTNHNGLEINRLRTIDAGDGPRLYATARSFAFTPAHNLLARFDAATGWSTFADVGTTGGISDMCAAPGGGIVVAGGFLQIGPDRTPALRVAILNNGLWQPMGAGLSETPGEGAGSASVDRVSNLEGRVYALGRFSRTGTTVISNLAYWDGVLWRGVGSPNTYTYGAEEAGGTHYIGGVFTQPGVGVAKVVADTLLLPLGLAPSASVTGLDMADDGTGPKLFLGGSVYTKGGQPSNGVARLDDDGWAPLGTGVTQGSARTFFSRLEGAEHAVYVGGEFVSAGGQVRNNIARWNGSSWSSLGTGLLPINGGHGARSMVLHDDGTGEQLYVGGFFDTAGGVASPNIARWNFDTSTWSAVGTGLVGTPRSMVKFDDGTGTKLYAANVFGTAGVTTNVIARFDGTHWQNFPSCCFAANNVSDFVRYDSPTGPIVAMSGTIVGAGSTFGNLPMVATWDGTAFAPLGAQFNSGGPSSLVQHDEGGGPELYAGGTFTSVGTAAAANVVRFRGGAWEQVGAGQGPVKALVSFNDGSGPAVLAGVTTVGSPAAGVATYSASEGWLGMGSGFVGGVRVAVRLPTAQGLRTVVGGDFTASGSTALAHVAMWNGTAWTPMGAGLNGSVRSMAIFDDGTGPTVFAGGAFQDSGGSPVNRLAKWNGVAWVPVAIGTAGLGPNTGSIEAMAVFDPGTGPRLYVGGQFASIGGVAATNIASWSGTQWQPLGAGIGGNGVLRMGVARAGASPAALYVTGDFTTAGAGSALRIAKWDGAAWSALSTGFTSVPLTLGEADLGSGPRLIVGGTFAAAGSVSASMIAQWNGTAWAPIGAGLGGGLPGSTGVSAITMFDVDGAGPLSSRLWVSGGFSQSGAATGFDGVAYWDGAAWQRPSLGIGTGAASVLIPLSDAPGRLFAGGGFTLINYDNTSGLAKWQNGQWTTAFNSFVVTLTGMWVVDTGSGPDLYVQGTFQGNTWKLARYHAGVWTDMSAGVGFTVISTLLAYDADGPGPIGVQLYAGAKISSTPFLNADGTNGGGLARWNGTRWVGVGNLGGLVGGLAVLDPDGPGPQNPKLLVGGNFQTRGAGAQTGAADYFVMWNGTGWEAATGTNAPIAQIRTLDLGQGPLTFVSGSFTRADFSTLPGLARWNGSVWEPVGTTSTAPAFYNALAVFDGPGGPSLYMGGRFSNYAGVTASNMIRYRAGVFSNVGAGTNSDVTDFIVANDGQGPALFVIGAFSSAGGAPAAAIAKYDGTNWSPLGTGLTGSSGQNSDPLLAAIPGPRGTSTLFASGSQSLAGGIPSFILAKWGCPAGSVADCLADFNHDGTLDPDDLGDFITCFFTAGGGGVCPGADYNLDGDVNPDDLGDFVTAFFVGCP